jgi:hypothetical protein
MAVIPQKHEEYVAQVPLARRQLRKAEALGNVPMLID